MHPVAYAVLHSGIPDGDLAKLGGATPQRPPQRLNSSNSSKITTLLSFDAFDMTPHLGPDVLPLSSEAAKWSALISSLSQRSGAAHCNPFFFQLHFSHICPHILLFSKPYQQLSMSSEKDIPESTTMSSKMDIPIKPEAAGSVFDINEKA